MSFFKTVSIGGQTFQFRSSADDAFEIEKYDCGDPQGTILIYDNQIDDLIEELRDVQRLIKREQEENKG